MLENILSQRIVLNVEKVKYLLEKTFLGHVVVHAAGTMCSSANHDGVLVRRSVFIEKYRKITLLKYFFPGKFSKNLRHYETLSVSDISHKLVKRGAAFSYHPYNTIKEVDFKTLGKHFRLILHPHKDVVHENFQAYEVRGDLPPKPVHVDHDSFYTGRVFGESDSAVRAHVDEQGLLTATVAVPSWRETYHIEPSWRHLEQPRHAKEMIAYRLSDVELDKKKNEMGHSHGEVNPVTCGFVKEGHELETRDGEHTTMDEYYEALWNGNRFKRSADYQEDKLKEEVHLRAKRQSDQYEYTPTKTRCPLLLVADYRFFQEMGQSNTKTTINYLVRTFCFFMRRTKFKVRCLSLASSNRSP